MPVLLSNSLLHMVNEVLNNIRRHTLLHEDMKRFFEGFPSTVPVGCGKLSFRLSAAPCRSFCSFLPLRPQ